MSKGTTSVLELVGAVVAVAAALITENPQYLQLAFTLAAAAYSTERQARADITARNAYNASLRDRYAMIRSATPARQLVFGRCRVSGPMFFGASYGPDNEHLTICVALAAHEIDAIETIYFDDKPITLDGSGNVIGVQQHDSFSITTSSATVTIQKTPQAGTVTAAARYGAVVVPLTVSGVSGVNVTVTGATAGQVGQLDVYYQPNPDPYAPNGVTQRSTSFPVATSTQTFTLASVGAHGIPIPAPDSSGVHVVYQVTTAQSDDSSPTGTATLSGYNVTLTGLTVGRTIVIYYQTSNGISKARVRKYLGAAGQTADAGMITNFPGTWTSNHKATGIAYLVVELDYDQDAFTGGVPQVSAVVRGMKCFDPRTSTTAWTENPALHARALATHSLAGALPTTCIDDAAVMAAASICDMSTTYTVGGINFVRPLYTAGYAFSVDSKPMDGLTDLCQAMGGGWVFADGQLRLNAGAYRTPNPGTLDETWLTDDDAVQIQVGYARASLVNTVTGTFADEYQDYTPVPLPRLSPSAYTGADGATLSQSIQYSAVTFSGQAQYISSCLMRRMRQGLVVKLRCNYRAWPAECYDVLNVSLSRFGWVNKPFEVIKDTLTADGSFELTLQETDPSIFNMDAGFTATDVAPNTSMPVPWGLPPITTLAGTSGDSTLLRQADGTVIPQIQVTWDAITDSRVLLGGYVEIRYWRMGDLVDSYQTVKASATDVQTFLNGVRDGSMYLIAARAVSVITTGPWCTQILVTASGKTVAPSGVMGMAYVLGNGRVHLSWDQNTVNPDYKLTEVRVGTSWAAGTKIGSPTSAALDWVQTTAGTYTVWFAHQNFSGVYSATPVSLSVVIDSTVNVSIAQASILPASAILPADAAGNVSSFSAGVTTMTVMEMPSGTDVTASWTITKADSTGVTSALSGAHNNVLTISAMSSANDTGYVDITATRTGWPNLTQRFVLGKSKSSVSTTGVNTQLGSVSGGAIETPHTVGAYGGIRFATDGRIWKKSGTSSATFSATSQVWWLGAPTVVPPTSGYTLTVTFVSANQTIGTSTLTKSGAVSITLGAANGDITANTTNGGWDLTYAYSITDATTGNNIESGNVFLSLESSD